MPRKPPADLDGRLIEHAANNPSGLGVEELLRLLKGEVSRRTLQRRLSALVRAGGLISEGAGPSTIYLLPKPAELEENYIPLSPSGAEVRQLVRKPQSERTPVSYKREFLDQYRPNKSHYLTADTIAYLARIGATADLERPAGTYARHILDRLLVDLSWASSRLEGNTYSLLDTERLIQFGEAAEGKDAIETQMILNHKAAIEFIVDQGDELAFDRQTVLNLHALLSDNLLPDPTAGGRLRRIAVGIHDSVYHPLELPPLIEEYFQEVVDTGAAIHNPIRASLLCNGPSAILAAVRRC